MKTFNITFFYLFIITAAIDSTEVSFSLSQTGKAEKTQGPVIKQIQDVFFSDPNHGWAAGSEIVRTTDGGKTWSLVETGYDTNFRTIWFIDSLKGFAGADWGLFIKTTDGGDNWERIWQMTGGHCIKIQFPGGSIGYVVYSNSAVFKTTDGGVTWEQQNLPVIDYHYTGFISAHFFNELTGYIVTNVGTLLKTSDGGLKWIDHIEGRFSGGTLHDIYFSDSLHAWKFSSGSDPNHWQNSAYSTDGGRTWAGWYIDGEEVRLIRLVDELNGFAVTLSGLLYITTDSCKSWIKKNSVSINKTYLNTFDLIKIFPVDKNSMYLAGNSLYKYSVSEDRWTDLLLGITTSLDHPVEKLHFSLEQNYPNPFNPSTRIRYSVPEETGFVSLKVYDILGTEIAVLVNEEKPAGTYETTFDGTNFSTGIYLCKLQSGKYSETKKIILMK